MEERKQYDNCFMCKWISGNYKKGLELKNINNLKLSKMILFLSLYKKFKF